MNSLPSLSKRSRTFEDHLAMEPGSRVRFKTAFDNTTTEPLSKLLFKAKTIVRSVALRLSRLALWLLLALKVTIKTSFNLAYNLGIMSSLTGGRKFLDTFRGVSKVIQKLNTGTLTKLLSVVKYQNPLKTRSKTWKLVRQRHLPMDGKSIGRMTLRS